MKLSRRQWRIRRLIEAIAGAIERRQEEDDLLAVEIVGALECVKYEVMVEAPDEPDDEDESDGEPDE